MADALRQDQISLAEFLNGVPGTIWRGSIEDNTLWLEYADGRRLGVMGVSIVIMLDGQEVTLQ